MSDFNESEDDMPKWLTFADLVSHRGGGIMRRRRCDHNWQYDEAESAGPWTGYIERCANCGALQQIPQ